jgi:hypothetical protein
LVALDDAALGDMAMPLLLLGLVIGAAMAFFYLSRSRGAPLFTGGETYILIDDGALRLRKG